MHSLILHPDCKPGPVHALSAQIEPTHGGCHVRFRIEGEISRIKIPFFAPPGRADDLWKTTCFECFWQHEGSRGYREFNFSPSSEWAAYDLEDYRTGYSNPEVAAVAVACAYNGDELTLHANIGAVLPLPAHVALTAVIEDRDGGMEYWSLAFPPGAPDFHHPACRTLKLAGAL
ncbi:MAG: DOMON-like domain-containing protein [Sphingomonadales bacterium]|nr:DOMON-like domain-containing protein [Sphingomonadales bacterium]MBD3773184.1 DOMON-like domain-containing protein [Paracoccaceae bacterium]